MRSLSVLDEKKFRGLPKRCSSILFSTGCYLIRC